MMLRSNYDNLLKYGLRKYFAMDRGSSEKPELREELLHFFDQVTDRIENDIEFIADYISVGEIMDKYLTCLMNVKIGMDRKTTLEPGNVLFILDILDETIKDSPVKNHILYRLNTKFMTYNPDYYLSHQSEFLSKFTSDAFREKTRIYTTQMTREISDISPMKNFKLEDLLVDDALTNAIEEAKGKKMYIDFWTTWCAPCLYDMKKSKAAVAKAEEKGDVVIIYVCVDQNEEARKNFIHSNQIPGKHIKLTREGSVKVMANFGNMAYPFQVIVWRDGNILAKGNQYRFTLPLTQRILSYERP